MKVSSGSATATEPALRRVPQQARSRALIQRVLDAAEDLLPDKGAIVDALAGRYLEEFEGLMADLAARAAAERWQGDELVDRLIDAYADRYRREPGYRALWFGRHLSQELRDADRRNKIALAEGVRRILVEGRLVRDVAGVRTACRAAVPEQAAADRAPP